MVSTNAVCRIVGLLFTLGGSVGGNWESAASAHELLPGFEASEPFSEQVCWMTQSDGVRVFLNAPRPLGSCPRRLVIFATPNGNTIEQTLGCKTGPGQDWRFDIQHVAAQVRQFREWNRDEDVVLAVVQAPRLSWPTYCRESPEAGRRVRELVESLRRRVDAAAVDLTAHSGGGSFLLAWVAAGAELPESTERIAFLDANYAFDSAFHAHKLWRWLERSARHRLIVIAYDDREIALNGKKVVGPDGGTFRASQRMRDAFNPRTSLTQSREGDFQRDLALDGRLAFWVHANPQNKILHTVLVGEMNGLIHSLTWGHARAGEWGSFASGARSYSEWVGPTPFVEPSKPPSPMTVPPGTWRVTRVVRPSSEELRGVRPWKDPFPMRSPTALSGTQLRDRLLPLTRVEREQSVVQEVLAGNIPSDLRRWVPIRVEAVAPDGAAHSLIYWVLPDYVAVGDDGDFFRQPLSPQAAQEIGRKIGGTLITRKISNDLWQVADIKLDPRPLTQDRESVVSFFHHHQLIERQRREAVAGAKMPEYPPLVVGIKKDIIWSNRLLEKPNKVAIFGWHYSDGRPIQPLYVGHYAGYVDYSHGTRLVANTCWCDGHAAQVAELLKDPVRCGLLSDEGPLDLGRLGE